MAFDLVCVLSSLWEKQRISTAWVFPDCNSQGKRWTGIRWLESGQMTGKAGTVGGKMIPSSPSANL